MPAASRTAKGQPIVNLLNLSPDERITSLIDLGDASQHKYLFMATKNGTVKKTKIEEYTNVRASGLIAIKLDKGDELKWVKKTTGENDIIISTAMAQAIRFRETDVRPMGRATRGVRAIRLRSNDSVVGMDVLDTDGDILVIMQNGYGKITKTSQFARHNRGGVGIRAGVVNQKTGQAVDVRVLANRNSDLLIISRQGQVIRLRLADIPVIGRSTQGVRIMRMRNSDTVASIAILPVTVEDLPTTSDGQAVKKNKKIPKN